MKEMTQLAPVLQRFITSAVCVFFGGLLLRKMALVVGSNSTHMLHVLVVIFRGIFLGVLFQDLNNLATTDRCYSCDPVLHRHCSLTFHDQRSHQSHPTLTIPSVEIYRLSAIFRALQLSC